MKNPYVDIVVIGAGPVGLMCAYLAKLCGLTCHVVDKSKGPIEVGRADALNARTLQFLEVAKLFDEIYPLGKKCNTSSVWANGQFVSRQSDWWDELEGCFHKHFLMLGQAHLEKILDKKLSDIGNAVIRNSAVEKIDVNANGCFTKLADGQTLQSKYIIGCDGSRSFVRETFKIPFVIERPQIIWAVIDAQIETDFIKVPEIIVFQNETADVAWIPREGKIDRFYVRMDTKDFRLEDALSKVNAAMSPFQVRVKELDWFSSFSVKESVAESFRPHERVFLAGDSCHIHSVNGGQGLNTGVADAFNLIWKLSFQLRQGLEPNFLDTYQNERKPVALGVIEGSGELVRSIKYSKNGTHGNDYVEIVKKRADYITGMGISYQSEGLVGQRVLDFEIQHESYLGRLYQWLSYQKFTLLMFEDAVVDWAIPDFVQVLRVQTQKENIPHAYWAKHIPYNVAAVLVRPDAYIAACGDTQDMSQIKRYIEELQGHESSK